MLYRTETEADHSAVEALYDLSFAPGRKALSSYRLREDVPPIGDLCLVAEDECGEIGGAIRYWPVVIGTAQVALLGPVAVHPIHQGEGVGAELILRSLDTARALKIERVLLVGDAPYYQRFGFERLSGVEMPPPTNPERILGLELAHGAWRNLHGAVVKWSAVPT